MKDALTQEEMTGERWSPTGTGGKEETIINLERYFHVLPHLENKSVLDAGCGNGLGTYLYSLVAKSVLAVDYRDEAIDYAMKFPLIREKITFRRADLSEENEIIALPPVQICVAIEFLEHLADPAIFLEKIKCKELVFSLPLHSLAVSKWHKFDIRTPFDVKKLIDPYFKVDEYRLQSNRWIYGHGIRR